MNILKRISPEKAGSTCSWCGHYIPDNVPVWGMGGKLRQDVKLTEFEGSGILIKLLFKDYNIIAVVPPPESNARKDGHDLLFMTCSVECGNQLKTALNDECKIVNSLLNSIDNIDLN